MPNSARDERQARAILAEALRLVPHPGIRSVVQCGLGTWAEGTALLELLPPSSGVNYIGFDPLNAAVEGASAAGHPAARRALLGAMNGARKTLVIRQDRTSIHYPVSKAGSRGLLTAEIVTLDSALAAEGFESHRALLWMDCEGSELDILRGAPLTLQRTEVIICEMTETHLPSWPKPHEMVAAMAEAGFGLAKTRREFGRDTIFLRGFSPSPAESDAMLTEMGFSRNVARIESTKTREVGVILESDGVSDLEAKAK